MKAKTKTMLIELMQQGCDEQLKQIRDGYLRWLPKELIHLEDREIVEAIDEYFRLNEPINLFSILGNCFKPT